MVNVYGENGWRHLATIHHSLVRSGFADVKMPDTFLDPLDPLDPLDRRTPAAGDLLRLYLESVLTPDHEDRLRRHRALVRGRIESDRSGPRSPRPPRRRP